MPRYFTLREARAALPVIARDVREAVHTRSRYQEADESLKALNTRILMNGGMVVNTTSAEAWKSQRDHGAQALKAFLGRMEERGVLVKDLDVGLIDFPTLYRGREVYLCWRMDEDDIDFWHGTDEGFAGRKLIDSDFLSHHSGDSI
ncbi:MAG TPA: DUF2203 domain-containing protein [Bryobacteraceae bacterium]|nr:DUF2203 domain-containing protein [Bryobacteraceae bacterium]